MNTILRLLLSALRSSRSGSAIAPHATDPLPATTRAIYVGGDGNIVLRLADDSADVTFFSVKAGTWLPVEATHVRLAGTTATNLLGLY